MKIQTLFLLLFALSFFSCNTKTQEKDQAKLMVLETVVAEEIIPVHIFGHIYIEGMVDSIKGNYLFDTGAHNLYFDQVFYDESGIKFSEVSKGIIGGAGTGKESVPLIMDKVSVDIDPFGTYTTSMVPVLKLKEILGDFVDGILGLDLFYESILEINYEDKYMKTYNSIDSIDLSGYKKIPISIEKRRLYIPLEVQVNDELRVKGEFLLDLGAGGSISFTSPTANKYQMEKMKNPKARYYTKYGGVGGEGESYSFQGNGVDIAGFSLDTVAMGFSLNKEGALSSERHSGLVGNKVFKNFHLVLDFINRNLYLKPNSSFGTDLGKESSLGFSFTNRSKTLQAWMVTGMYVDSNAEKSGLKIDDHITHVNGKTVLDVPFGEENKLFEGKESVELVVVRNENETLTIRFDKKDVY